MQHFLKSSAGATRTEIVAPEFLGQFFVPVNYASASSDVRL